MLYVVLKHKLRYVFVVALEMCLLVDVCNTRRGTAFLNSFYAFNSAKTPFTAHPPPSRLPVLADGCLLPFLLRQCAV